MKRFVAAGVLAGLLASPAMAQEPKPGTYSTESVVCEVRGNGGKRTDVYCGGISPAEPPYTYSEGGQVRLIGLGDNIFYIADREIPMGLRAYAMERQFRVSPDSDEAAGGREAHAKRSQIIATDNYKGFFGPRSRSLWDRIDSSMEIFREATRTRDAPELSPEDQEILKRLREGAIPKR